MKSFGKCYCGEPIIVRSYKLKGSKSNFRRLFRCKKSVSHSYSDAQIAEMDIDIEYYKRIFEGIKK